MKSGKWTKEEIEFLRDNCATMTHKQIAAVLDRCPKAVKSQAANRKFGYRFRFTAEHIETLKREYPTTRAEDLAARFGCKMGTVYNKAQALDIKKDPQWLADNARESIMNPNHPGRKTQFSKGVTVWNKGMKGFCAPGSEKGHFKKGNAQIVGVPVRYQAAERCLENAGEDFKEAYRAFLLEYAATPAQFTNEEVCRVYKADPSTPKPENEDYRACGGIVASLKRKGIIQHAGITKSRTRATYIEQFSLNSEQGRA